MADNNIQIKQKNSTGWDNLFPITKAGNVTETTDKQFVTSAQKTTWNAKQDALGFTPENIARKGIANGYASLDSGGRVPQSQLPDIAITNTYVVNSQSAMLALVAQVGDIAIRSDESKTYILREDGASILSNWQLLATPTDAVLSVNGKVGAVTLAKGDVGLGNVTNESKATMFTNPAFTGTPTAPTPASGTNTTQLATTAFVMAEAGKQTTKIPVTATEPTNLSVGDFWYNIV